MKERKFIIIAQCLVNPYCRVRGIGYNFHISNMLISYLLRHRIGIIDYPCPETAAMGLMRNPQGRQQYDNIFFREHCRELLEIPVLMVKEFIKNRYKPVAFLGIENSPSCGIKWRRHGVNKYSWESLDPDSVQDTAEDAQMGIMSEILYEELKNGNINMPFLEVPIKENMESEKIQKFLEKLKSIVERADNV